MNRLNHLALMAAAFFLFSSAALFPLGRREKPKAQLAGTVLSEPSPAPDFTLTDQRGSFFRMAETKGKVLTFIYTHCTDVCLFISLKLKEAHALLGKEAYQVAFLAVTTDPARDTPPVIAAYSKEVGLFDIWHFMTGSVAAVQAVWNSYHIGVHIEAEPTPEPRAAQPPESSDEHYQGLNREDQRLASRIIEQFGGGYEVTHAAPFWIIDRAGNIRAVLDANSSPQNIAADARTLIRER
jgi:protein SCO1/2